MRFSNNLIRHLEENNQWERFRGEYNPLHDRDKSGRAYANTIAGCMEIAHDLNDKGIPYCVMGGLAVAFHLHQVDHNAFLNWRGTSDIDLLAAKKTVEGTLRENGYQYAQIKRGMKGASAGIYDFVKDCNGERLVLGLREKIEDRTEKDITNTILKHSTLVDVYSVPIRVPMIRDIIAMKRFANRSRDREDIKLLKRAYKGLEI